MRLSRNETEQIISILRSSFGADIVVVLFGSRVDDTRKGGDIDLLVEIHGVVENQERTKVRAISQIQLSLGIQKIDLLLTRNRTEDPRIVVREAIRKGLVLYDGGRQ